MRPLQIIKNLYNGQHTFLRDSSPREKKLKDINYKSTYLIFMQQLQIPIKQAHKELSFKIERIVSAVYLVVSHINKEDPILHTLKAKSLELLNTKNSTLSDTITEAKDMLAAHIRVAKLSNIISEMNADILLNALDALSVVSVASELKPYTLPENFFGYTENMIAEPTISPKIELTQKEIIYNQTQTKQLSHIEEKKSDKGDSIQKISSYTKELREISTGKKLDLALKLTRRNTLLKLIKDRGAVSIKECMSVISDCSEKTIQRELTTLVDQHVLKKTGDKRWSRYSLA